MCMELFLTLVTDACVLITVDYGSSWQLAYRIAGKFGEGFNLAIWRPVTKSPN